MSERDNGGPAFPHYARVGDVEKSDGGMSVRDYFAGQVLPEVFASAIRDGKTLATIAEIAEKTFQISDAMLEARKR